MLLRLCLVNSLHRKYGKTNSYKINLPVPFNFEQLLLNYNIFLWWIFIDKKQLVKNECKQLCKACFCYILLFDFPFFINPYFYYYTHKKIVKVHLFLLTFKTYHCFMLYGIPFIFMNCYLNTLLICTYILEFIFGYWKFDMW